MLKPLVSLAAISLACALLLATTHMGTTAAIRENREARDWRLAFELLGTFGTAGLDVAAQTIHLPDGRRLERARVFGYGGDIGLLIAYQADGALAGVRVTGHRETPGLGDFIDAERSPWILQFADRGVNDVDTVTGATITSLAVKRGVEQSMAAAR